MIVQELTLIQERHGWLPEGELRALSRRLSVPLHRLHEVASFYPLYRLKPPPAVHVQVCRDMACHLHGAVRMTRDLEATGMELGGGQVHVEGVSCLGQCDRPIAISINDHVYRGLSEDEIRTRIRMALAREPLPHQHGDRTPANWKIDVYQGRPTYDAVRQFIETRDGDRILKALEVANLRGMGGAGFPTFKKWGAVRGAPGDVKYVVCNADESEPGTFKDRELMRRAPWLVIEGVILAGLVTGAKQGTIYIRHEYHEETHVLRDAIAQAEASGICGDNVLGSGISFPVDVFVSPGGYIQGEESALLEAMEDRRGEPRNKPPFPVFVGLFGKPTVINNVETLAWVPGIVKHGGEWYRDAGINGANGMRFVSISGDVAKPGVYEVPFGQTVRDLIFNTAGGMRGRQRLKAIAPSGPSGGFLPAKIKVENLPPKFVQEKMKPGDKTLDILDVPLDLNTLGAMGSMLGAAFVVYGDQADIVENALNCTEFYRNESCGKCVPCRMGSQKLVEIIGDMLAKRFPRTSLPMVNELSDTMTITSICGLGMVASNPIATVIKHFPDELNQLFETRAPRRTQIKTMADIEDIDQ
ncbi:MAG: NAD(P)H-dependent oxidoreductase subunit E [Gemmataceae bacterium]|nr:NAD(P)H-dependent oxidoreductase subunit E [Gemmataceae bacterium]